MFLLPFGRLQAQIVKGEVFFGGNGCQVDGDECYGYKRFGLHAGAGALVPLTSYMDIGLEVLFNQKGTFKKQAIVHNSSFPFAYDLKLNYAEVPLMVYLTDKNVISAGIGVSYGRVVGLSEKQDGVSTGIGLGDGKLHWKDEDSHPDRPDLDGIQNLNELSELFFNQPGIADTALITDFINNSSTYLRNDFCFCADLRYRIWEGLHAELRYQYSIRPIRTRMFYENVSLTLPSEIRLQYNNTITLRLVYIFHEQQSKSNKAAQKADREKKY